MNQSGDAVTLPSLNFDTVTNQLNVFTGRDRTETFARLVLSEARRFGGEARVLDVGCGRGLSVNNDPGASALAGIRSGSAELWGCEPDPDIVPSPLLHHFARGTLEDADLPRDYFDVVYAHLVVEHVADPIAFLSKALRILRPGGRLLFITPNERHYFVKVARLVAALHLEETVLNVIHKEGAKAHYPTKYLLNGAATIQRAARKVGFARAEFAYFEHGDVRSYFPRPLKWIPLTLEKLMRVAGPTRLPALVARLER
jgi:SAM-dependent methyltransferase